MDRVIVYPGQAPRSLDLLLTNRNAMVGFGMALQALMGSATVVDGLAIAPTAPASLQVQVGQGAIYAQSQVDPTAYSSLAADTTDLVVKQGLVFGTTTLTLTPPAASGQSQVYLVQAAFQETDGGSLLLPYYNASNPAQPWQGPNNGGTSQFTLRQGQCVIGLKAGAAAATGSQAAPAADAGYVGLYAVTAANGQSTITAANIATLGTAPFLAGRMTDVYAAITTAVTKVVGPNAGADFPTLTAAIAWLSLRRIMPAGSVTLSLQAGQQVYSGAANSIVFAHPDGLRVTITGQTPTVPTNGNFAITGNTSGARAADAATNLAMARTKWPTELRLTNGALLDIRGNLGGLSNLLVTSDASTQTVFGAATGIDGITLRFGYCPLTTVGVTGFSGNGVSMVAGSGGLQNVYAFGNSGSGIAASGGYTASMYGYVVGWGNGINGLYAGSSATLTPGSGASITTYGNANDGITASSNGFITLPAGAISNSNGGNGFGANFGGELYASSTSASGNGNSGYYACYDGFILAPSTGGSGNAQYGYYANYKSEVVATSGGCTGAVATCTPAINTIGNNNSLVTG